jgi:recombination protein RecT
LSSIKKGSLNPSPHKEEKTMAANVQQEPPVKGANLQELRAQAQTKEPVNFPAMLERYKGEIAKALPRHLSPDRMARIALTAFRRTPKLAECDPRSVFAAVIQAAQLGLEIDTLGRAYLIPYEQRKKVGGEWKTVAVECQFIPGWKGLVDLVNRAGNATVWTGSVFEGDEFDYALGDSPYCKHRPAGEDDPNKLTHVYAIGRVKGAEWPVIEVWPIARVVKHRDRYNKVGQRHYSFGNWEMYARKVVLLQVLKYMPASADLSAAVALNDAAEMGEQHLTVKDAIEGTWAPVPESVIDPTTGEIQGNGADPEFLAAMDAEAARECL